MRFSIRRHVLALFLVVGFGSLPAQNKASIPVRLKQLARVEMPQQYRIIKPIHCDLLGRLHALAQHDGGSPIPIRINGVPRTGQPLQITVFGEPGSMFENPTGYSIYDYAPDTAGGLYAIAIERNRKASIIHFSSRGLTSGVVHVTGVVPKRLAVFADGKILIFGLQTDGHGKEKAAPPWVTQIVSPDGKLLNFLTFDPSSLLVPHVQTNRVSLSEEEAEEVELHIDFRSARDGNIYAVLPASVSSPGFGEPSRVAVIMPSGEIRPQSIPVPTGRELFGFVLGADRKLALFGTRGTDSEPGVFDDLRELVPASNGGLQLSHQYRALGAPACISDGILLVIRPNGRSDGGTSIVSYRLPDGGGTKNEY